MLTTVALHHLVDVSVSDRNARVKAHSVIACLSKEELSTGVLTRQTMKRFGVRSPKLTKLLPQELAELVGQLTRKSDIKVATYADTKDLLYVQHQSDSKHYSSCMSTGVVEEQGKGCNAHRVPEDQTAYRQGSLHIAYIGDSYHKNQEGYIARAKLRVVYKDATKTEVLGCAVENIYGDRYLFQSNIDTLAKWVKSKYGEHCQLFQATNYPENQKGIIKSVYIPSHGYGYQDTTTSTVCCVYPYEVTDNMSYSIKRALKHVMRDRRDGNYTTPASAYMYIHKGSLYHKSPEYYRSMFRLDVPYHLRKDKAGKAAFARHAHEMMLMFGFVKRNDDKGVRYYRNGEPVSCYVCETYSYSVRIEVENLGYIDSKYGFVHYEYRDKAKQQFQQRVGLTEDMPLSCDLPSRRFTARQLTEAMDAMVSY